MGYSEKAKDKIVLNVVDMINNNILMHPQGYSPRR